MPTYEKLELIDEVLEPAGFAYDPVQHIIYSRRNGWQRKYGYCRAYDEAAAHFSMIFQCEPFYFDYDNKEWLLEFWKGQYGVTTGCEVGLYYREKKAFSENEEKTRAFAFFQAADDRDFPLMSIRLVKKERELFQRNGRHWWLTGFVLGEFSKPKQLLMEAKLRFKNPAMAQAAARAIQSAGYGKGQVSLFENQVYFRFEKPKTRQPFFQMKLFVWFQQLQNKILCRKYRKLIETEKEPLEKLLALRQKHPKLLNRLLRIGGNRTWKEGRMPFLGRKRV